MTKEQATREAEKCARLLRGNWKIRIWNNMDWYWEVIQYNLRVRALRKGGYSAGISCKPGSATYGAWCKFGDTGWDSDEPNEYNTYDADPNKAVEEAIRQYLDWWEIARKEPETIQKSIENFQNLVK